ncbi:PrsW family intramembrane metalloprotease [Enterovirga rhinocerotis]|uniref:RsiW-degrading membrane proteinase PrsW (M82 family) n=1 Tax=Enterovirga rhinocerotis TaxID=1339210 RepID=A0A4R7C6S3_9HYPH|nr:PrsW family glutamic-type intramembrane protease [Enterovirga rhinocerotis]TDR93961.1 RsiW-degrading membrane proteinase PrsW (M82 family) [Enterovirga rhinocerotis]
MAQMPPLPQQPDTGLTATELMPFRSKKISLRKSRALIPLIAVALTCVLLFVLKFQIKDKGDVVAYMNVLAAFMLFAMFATVYFYSGERKNMLWYLVPASIVMWQLDTRAILGGFIYVFRTILPGDMKGEGFIPNFIGMFFGAGLMEELMKGIPILLALLLAYWLRRSGKPGNFLTRNLALQGPLDGLLMGVAAGAGFIAFETMAQYVPMEAAKARGNEALGLLHALLLMLPRVLNGLVGHMAYAGIFGYFIGLAVTHRRSLWTLLAIGWVLPSVLHAFWNSSYHLMGTWGFYASAGLTLFFFLACLLKAKQLEVSRLGGPIGGGSILAASPAPGTAPLAPAGVVPPPAPGVAGVFTGIATAAEKLAGVTARTTVPNPGAVPADAAGAVPAAAPMPASGLSIGNGAARYALAPDQSIDFSALFGSAGVPPGCAGVIAQAADGGLDIRNTGTASWAFTTPDGATTSVQPGASLRPVAGSKLLLGSATIEISAY